MESLDGILKKIMFHKPSAWNPSGTPFLIGALYNGTTIKGELASPRIGENYRFWGQMAPQKGGRGDAFEFSAYEVTIDESEAGVALYLRNYVPGLGHVKAAALVEHFGAETLAVLRATPERAADCHGITPGLVESIRKHFDEDVRIDPVAFAKLSDLFKPYKVARKTITQIVTDFGSSAVEMIAAEPYTILLDYPRMGWKTVDAIAQEALGYPADGVDRHAAAIVESLNRIGEQGHTYAERAEIEEQCFKLGVGMPSGDGWVACLSQQRVVADTLDDRDGEYQEEAATAAHEDAEALSPEVVRDQLHSVYFRPGVKFMLPKIAAAELEIARRLVMLGGASRGIDAEIDVEGLNADQRRAVRIIPENGVSLIVGGPGTGKTYSLGRVLSGFVNAGITNIRLVAPTGKAAKRAAEVLALHLPGCSIPCTTIHKALAPMPSMEKPGVPKDSAKIGRGREAFGFSRNEANPLEEQIVVIDETSMVDVALGASLLRAIAPGTTVVFVGDHNQLPSVGPGSMLRDMLDAGLPSSVLNEIQRSDSAGRVVHACHAIKDGRIPVPADSVSMPRDNWVHIEIEDQADIAQFIVDAVQPKKVFPDVLWDIQVVTPQRQKHATACANLNRMLSAKLNPWPPGDGDQSANQPGDDGSFEPMFRAKDKVVRNKNGIADQMILGGGSGDGEGDGEGDDEAYQDWTWQGHAYSFRPVEIVNGDMGIVEDIVIGPKKSYVVVRFRNPDRLCRLPMAEHHLSLAYAITCHKFQGSGAPFIIVPVHPAFYWDEKTHTGVFSREWIYTALSRAEKLLVTVGQFSAIRAAVGRKTVDRRRTRLADLIRRERELHTERHVVAGMEERFLQLQGAGA